MSQSEITRDDFYIPDKPKNKPVVVRHISLTAQEARQQGWHYKIKSGGRLRITQYNGFARDIIVPAEIDGMTVNEVKNRVFYGADMDNIEFPGCIRKIGAECCRQSRVRTIRLAEGITDLPNVFAFGCTSLEAVQFPTTLRSIGRSAFESCRALTYISIPPGCIRIGGHAFARCALKGFAYEDREGSVSAFHGTALMETPLSKQYYIILKSDPSKSGSYDLLLRGYDTRLRNAPSLRFQNAAFSFGNECLETITNKVCTFDLSGCRKVSACFGEPSVLKFWTRPSDISAKKARVILPKGTKGVYFPPCIDAKYADGREYDGYLTVTAKSAEETVLSPQGDVLPSFSLMHSAKKLVIDKGKGGGLFFHKHAVCSEELEHIVFSSLSGGEEELFSRYCRKVRCVEWNGNRVYITPAELSDYFVYNYMLESFAGKDIFDSSRFTRMLLEQDTKVHRYSHEEYMTLINSKEYRKKRPSPPTLKQKQKILLCIDVLRSTASLFPDRWLFERYLTNHRRYAMILCDSLPEEYRSFLHEYFGV